MNKLKLFINSCFILINTCIDLSGTVFSITWIVWVLIIPFSALFGINQRNWRASHSYVSVYSQSNMQMFCLKKLISQHWGVQKSPFLEEMTLTQYTLRYICFWTPQVPPICLKTPKCAIFSTFWESHLKHTPKVGVHRENLLIGKCCENEMTWIAHFGVFRHIGGIGGVQKHMYLKM